MEAVHSTPVYALDFDGVICDSSIETAITGWKAAQILWTDMVAEDIPEQLIEQFRLVRPLLETGYEAILIVRLLQTGLSAGVLCQHYEKYTAELIKTDQLDTTRLKALFGSTRDTWIKENEQEWLSKNLLFAGVAEKLLTLKNKAWYIITTKQERFVKRILKGNGIVLADDCIFGMDRRLSKQQVLQRLLEQNPDNNIVFVEDRLPTLLGIIKNKKLDSINLQFANWGYNTVTDQKQATSKGIELIDLAHFIFSS